jgi:hypothetical protein
VRHHPFANGLKIASQVELGYWLAVNFWPKRFIGLADGNTHHNRGLLHSVGDTLTPHSRRFREWNLGGRTLRLDFVRGLILTQTPEGCLSNIAIAGKPGEFNLSDHFRSDPVDVRFRFRSDLPAERASVRSRGL